MAQKSTSINNTEKKNKDEQFFLQAIQSKWDDSLA